jgi:hypothetical protein
MKSLDVLTHRHDIPGQFVTEQSRRHDHAGVVTAAEDLHVRTAGEGGADSNQEIAFFDFGDGNTLYLDMFFAVEHGCHH